MVGQIERTGPLQAGTLGISLKGSKALLQKRQQAVVRSQFRAPAESQRLCDVCGARRAIKGYHKASLTRLLGDVDWRIPRFHQCRCDGRPAATETVNIEGLEGWVSPELLYSSECTRRNATLRQNERAAWPVVTHRRRQRRRDRAATYTGDGHPSGCRAGTVFRYRDGGPSRCCTARHRHRSGRWLSTPLSPRR